MGLLLLLGLAVAASVWVGVVEDDLEAELARVYCKECGAEVLDDDECCIICGTPSPKPVVKVEESGSEKQEIVD